MRGKKNGALLARSLFSSHRPRLFRQIGHVEHPGAVLGKDGWAQLLCVVEADLAGGGGAAAAAGDERMRFGFG